MYVCNICICRQAMAVLYIVCTLYRLHIDMQQMFRYGLVYNGKQCKYTAFVHMHLQEKNTKKD